MNAKIGPEFSNNNDSYFYPEPLDRLAQQTEAVANTRVPMPSLEDDDYFAQRIITQEQRRKLKERF